MAAFPWLDVAGLGIKALGSIGDIFGTKSTNETNREIAQQQMQWQSDENEKAFQRNVQMFNMENAYNDPSAVMARLKNAGVNPFIAFGSGSASSMSSAASGNVTSGGVSPVMPAQTPVPTGFGAIVSGLSQGLSQYANTLKTVAEAKKLGVDTSYIEAKLPKELEGMELGNKLQAWRLEFEKEWAPKIKEKELQEASSRITKNLGDWALAIKEGRLKDAQTAESNYRSDVLKLEKKYKETQLEWLPKQLAADYEQRTEAVKTQQAQTKAYLGSANASNASASASLATASLTNEQAYQLRAMRDDNIKIRQTDAIRNAIQAGKDSKEFSLLCRTFEDQIAIVKNNKLASAKEVDYLEQQYRKAKKEADWYEFNTLMNHIEKIGGIAVTGLSRGLLPLGSSPTPPASIAAPEYAPSSTSFQSPFTYEPHY